MFNVSKVLFSCLFAATAVKFSLGASLGFYSSRSVGSTDSGLVSRATNFDFTNSKWIWTSELVNGNAPPGTRPFRKDFPTPAGKTARFADVLITTDNALVMYVNGAQVGTGSNFHFAERFCIKLEPCNNITFAVSATNAATVPNPAGVLAAIQITYSDGTTDMIYTDASWRTNTVVPAGFEQPSFDDSTWPMATVEGNYGVAPWGIVAVPTDPATVTFANTFWIWTNEVVNGQAPVGARAFRKTYTLPAGQGPTIATILITTDNEYTLYVNGKEVGSGTNWPNAQRYVVNLQKSSDVVFAVYAVNTGGPAGVLASIEINSEMPGCDCTSGEFLFTDNSWKSNTGVPTGFQLPGYDDSSWPAATVVGSYGDQPWGTITTPTTTSPGSPPLPGAPA